MKFTFSKYQGTGNDFIIIDNRDSSVNLTKKQIAQICDRRFGVGADGLMFLEKHPTLDFNMRYFNSDGNEGSMCGNGGRCLVAFAKSLAIIDQETTFNTIDGTHKALIKQKNIVALKMQDIKDIDVYTEGKKIRESKRFATKGTNVNFVEINNNNLFVRTYERGVEDET